MNQMAEPMAPELGEHQAFEVEPIGPTIGAEIHGIDLRRTLDEDSFQRLEQALIKHKVIYARDQFLDAATACRARQAFRRTGSPPFSSARRGRRADGAGQSQGQPCAVDRRLAQRHHLPHVPHQVLHPACRHFARRRGRHDVGRHVRRLRQSQRSHEAPGRPAHRRA
jgi:hypothetical protein